MKSHEGTAIYKNVKLAFKLGVLVWVFVYALASVLAQLVGWWLGVAVFAVGNILGLSISTLLVRSADLALGRETNTTVVFDIDPPPYSIQGSVSIFTCAGYGLLQLLVIKGQLILAIFIAVVVSIVALLLANRIFDYYCLVKKKSA